MSSNPVYNTQKVSLQTSFGYIARPYIKISNSLESYVNQPKLESNSVLQKGGSILTHVPADTRGKGGFRNKNSKLKSSVLKILLFEKLRELVIDSLLVSFFFFSPFFSFFF